MKPAPLHERIRAEIETAIMSGDLRPGDRIPKETDLMAQYDCARMTVNKALSALAAAGMLERRKRAGSFVARPRAQSLVLEVPDLAAAIAARGQAYRWDLASHKVTAPDADLTVAPPGSWLIAHVPWTEAENRISAAAAPPAVARALGIARGAPCLMLERRTWRGPDTVTRVRQHFVADRYELVARFGPTGP